MRFSKRDVWDTQMHREGNNSATEKSFYRHPGVGRIEGWTIKMMELEGQRFDVDLESSDTQGNIRHSRRSMVGLIHGQHFKL